MEQETLNWVSVVAESQTEAVMQSGNEVWRPLEGWLYGTLPPSMVLNKGRGLNWCMITTGTLPFLLSFLILKIQPLKKFIALLIIMLPLFALAGEPVKCKGTTKAGAPCKSIMVNKATGYCRAHDPSAHRCGAPTSTGKPCQMVTKEGLCRFHAK